MEAFFLLIIFCRTVALTHAHMLVCFFFFNLSFLLSHATDYCQCGVFFKIFLGWMLGWSYNCFMMVGLLERKYGKIRNMNEYMTICNNLCSPFSYKDFKRKIGDMSFCCIFSMMEMVSFICFHEFMLRDLLLFFRCYWPKRVAQKPRR